MKMSKTSESIAMAEYEKYKAQMTSLETQGDTTSKNAISIRTMLFQLWNKLTPEQQREIAKKYIPSGSFS
jgi:hypothetical protein